MSKQVCDISASTGMSRGQSTEHLRNYTKADPDAKKYGYYDPTRMGLNFEITKGGIITDVNKSFHIDKRIEDNLQSRGIQTPKPIKCKDGTFKDRRIIANIILGGSRQRMLELAFGDQQVDLTKDADNSHITRHKDIEEWARDQYKLMCKLYGEENIASFIVHLDEKNPHVHCTVIPVKDGKISYNKVFGGTKEESRDRFRATHDAVAEVNKRWGLERGENINITKAKHRTTEEYLHDLREECNRLESKKGTLQDDIAGLKESVHTLEEQVRRNEIKVKGLTTQITNKMSLLDSLQKELQELQDSVLDETVSQMEAEKQTKQLESMIQQNQNALDRKRRDLEETKRLLELLKRQVDEKNAQLKELDKQKTDLQHELTKFNEEKLDRLERDIFSDFGRYLLDMSEDIMGFLNNKIRPCLDMEHRRRFDGFFNSTILPGLAENGDAVLKTVAALFLGREGDAIDIASSAGGGGNPDEGWRRHYNEDDDEYRYRLIGTAVNMIRNSKGNNQGMRSHR